MTDPIPKPWRLSRDYFPYRLEVSASELGVGKHPIPLSDHFVRVIQSWDEVHTDGAEFWYTFRGHVVDPPGLLYATSLTPDLCVSKPHPIQLYPATRFRVLFEEGKDRGPGVCRLKIGEGEEQRRPFELEVQLPRPQER